MYDNETGLYYLQSRYYDPETGRFLNSDDVDYIGYSGEVLSYNAFAYCENEPVNCEDPLGFRPQINRRAWGGYYSLSIFIPWKDISTWCKWRSTKAIIASTIASLLPDFTLSKVIAVALVLVNIAYDFAEDYFNKYPKRTAKIGISFNYEKTYFYWYYRYRYYYRTYTYRIYNFRSWLYLW